MDTNIKLFGTYKKPFDTKKLYGNVMKSNLSNQYLS